ncbi:hypothetical protein G9C85_01825 [Halorubellus sp. JP-L1]|uniref:hypothetical protein n=1 Tax=Halorubellus sp. JP-L1 TaxID=2715753 RepID=UPI001408B5EF|nr:hypothetical protein [Halorubellus sp. JP-L1]NHN40375.1 hypothetical protein [Halorubellus sp. JP-L1]
MSEPTSTSPEAGRSDTLDVEDLFGTDDTDVSIDDEASDDHTTTPDTATTPGPEDTTANELFQQLRDEHDDDDSATAVTDVAGESPEDIMARADEEEAHVDQIDDAIRADERALDDLLLTERREADGFLWVETEDDAERTADVSSLFATGDDEASADTTVDDATAIDDPATGRDDFSLSDDAGSGSFEERAATFDDVDLDDAAVTDGEDPDDAAVTDDEDPDATVDEPDTSGASDESADEPDDDGEKGGLASRIRSILTG